MAVTTTQTRDHHLHDWLRASFPTQNISHQRLAGDASFRAYHRLQVEQNGKIQHYIVMDAPPEKESVTEFIAVAKLLKSANVNAPELVAIDEQQGFIVLEDFGATDFADVLDFTTADTDKIAKMASDYQKAMQTILAIQQIDVNQAKSQANLPVYDAALLSREMGLFSEWLLPYLNVELDSNSQALWQNVQHAIIQAVTSQPQVVVHRDFHSRNLMVLDSNELGVIDFQDAVIGAYTYDLASLLRDAYIDFDENWVTRQVKTFYQLADIEQKYAKSLAEFTAEFNVMSLQRHLKVLGIFIRLSQRDGKDRYLANMPKVMGDLLFSLQALNNASTNPSFQAFYEWITTQVVPKFNQKFNQKIATDLS